MTTFRSSPLGRRRASTVGAKEQCQVKWVGITATRKIVGYTSDTRLSVYSVNGTLEARQSARERLYVFVRSYLVMWRYVCVGVKAVLSYGLRLRLKSSSAGSVYVVGVVVKHRGCIGIRVALHY